MHIRLINSGLKAEQVAVHVTLPAEANYVPGSATASQGSVTGSGPLDFTLGAVDGGGSVDLRYAMAVPADAEVPLALTSQLEVDWSMGRLVRTVPVIAGGTPLYLPAVAR